MPNLLIVIGATAVTTVAYPMVSYQLQTQRWAQVELAQTVTSSDPAQPVQAIADGIPQPKIVDGIDYTKASNWFLDKNSQANKETKSLKNSISAYTLSIPKLKIEDMEVVIGGENLDEHLIHYEGTALPGELGNPVIFGHSVLPVFYNPKSYISVFSLLPTLKPGDDIEVNYDGVEYTYRVSSYHEVQPDQIEVLEQRYDRKTLTLITCVPPGTFLRRGVILAELVEN